MTKRRTISLKLTVHAQDMIQFRGINIDHMRAAIREPDYTKTAFEGTIKSRKAVGKRKTIEVVYHKERFRDTNEYLVITAYYTTT